MTLLKLIPLAFAASLLLGALTGCGPRQTESQMCTGALVLKSGPYAGMTPDQMCRAESQVSNTDGDWGFRRNIMKLAPGETLTQWCRAAGATAKPVLDMCVADIQKRSDDWVAAQVARQAAIYPNCMQGQRQIYAGCMAELNGIDRTAFAKSMADPGPVPFQPNYQPQPQQPIYTPSPGLVPVPPTPSGLVQPPAQPQLNNFQLQLQRDNFPQPVFK